VLAMATTSKRKQEQMKHQETIDYSQKVADDRFTLSLAIASLPMLGLIDFSCSSVLF
jgi:hypothetical protein